MHNSLFPHLWNSSAEMFAVAWIVLGASVLIWVYRNVLPPPAKICGSPNGPPITSPRIKLSNGRHLAYKEQGVAKEVAKYKVILAHGMDSSKDVYLPISKELMDELGLYIVKFDRAGYGESDPNPKRSVKGEAFDIQELADQLQLGPKFYVMGASIGCYSTWSCLKYIPHRLAGAALIVPVTNYWWPSFPSKLCDAAFKKQVKMDQRQAYVAHYAPKLLYWYLTQKWFPASTLMERNPVVFSKRDIETITKMSKTPIPHEHKIRQQGLNDSLFKDMKIGFGKWEFDPMELDNPFPNNEASVHIWQGYEDRVVPFELQRYLAEKLPWIHYHEVPDGGHMIIHEDTICEAIFKTLLLGKKAPLLD